MKKTMIKQCLAAFAFGLTGLVAGCGGGGSSAVVDGGGGSPAGIALPSEISAVSVETGAGAGASLSRALRAMAARAVADDLPADSDYHVTKTIKYVDEPALEVFGMVETVLQAVSQTNYADAGNVGAGQYKVMVAWEEEMEGRTQKSLQEWTVKSEMVTEGGREVNELSMWMQMEDEEIQAHMKIYEAPSQDADGNYLNYGKWVLYARFNDAESGESLGGFYAEADIDADGAVQMRLTDIFMEMEEINGDEVLLRGATKAIMHKSTAQGYGKVVDVNWDYCWSIDWADPEAQSPCVVNAVDGVFDFNRNDIPNIRKNIQYAYNQGYLAIKPPAGSTVFKDRNDKGEMVRRYGVFSAETGADVTKTFSFGFPIRYQQDGSSRHAYYGAWQGRHQIWTPGGTLPDGTEVTKQDVPPGQEAPVYTTETFQGALTKRILTDADLDQIKGVPVEIWLNDFFFLIWDGDQWQKCADADIQWGGPEEPTTCDSPQVFNMASLAVDPNTDRKHVHIGRWDQEAMQNMEFAYAPLQESKLARRLAGGGMESYDPEAGHLVNVSIGGSIYIEYVGIGAPGNTGGWVEKTLSSFDRRTWTPEFDDELDSAYNFPVDTQREYYINSKGTNFVVKRTSAEDLEGSYSVKMELQQVANPENAGSANFVKTGVGLTGVTFRESWAGDGGSTYAFDPETLMLEFATVGSNDSGNSVGDVVTKDIWGLTAYVGAEPVSALGMPVQFNWEYADSPGDWGSVTYLKDEEDNYVLLDNPLTFDTIELENISGNSRSYALQFDGWMHGLPDIHSELAKVGFRMTEEIRNKIVNIQKGTELTESSTNAKYYVKPLEVGVVLKQLNAAPAGAPDVTDADDIDLNTLPTLVEILASINLEDVDPNAVLKYVEGKAVE